MKFDFIIGNPPYQEQISDNENNASLAKQLFPAFIENTINTGAKHVMLITPSRWFAADAQDKSFVKLREFFKKHNHIKLLTNFVGKPQVFENVNVGNVSYFLYDKDYCGDVKFTEISGASVSTVMRPLFEKGLDIVITMNNPNLFSILNKVRYHKDFVSLMKITTGRNAFGIIGKNINDITKDEYFEEAVTLRCSYEEIRYIEEEKITKNINILNSWKVITSKANGGAGLLTDNKPVDIIGKSYLAGPKTACTDSLIPIGCFREKSEAEHLQKYMKTKFLRFMVGIIKSSQNLSQPVYRFVPMQDFTSDSDIDWSKSVPEIDQQLFAKYGLDDDEIDFIESHVKEMN